MTDGKVDLQKEEAIDFKDYAASLEEDLERSEATIALLEKKVREFQMSGWNEQRAVKLRRLETFYHAFKQTMSTVTLSTIYDKDKASETLNRLRELADQELKYLPENPWHDESFKKTSET